MSESLEKNINPEFELRKKGKFFYWDKFFENEEEFLQYIKFHDKKIATEDDIRVHFDILKQNMIVNYLMYGIEMTNKELSQLIFETSVEFCKKIQGNNEKGNEIKNFYE